MSSPTDRDPEQIIRAIFSELPFRSGARAEDQRTAERIYRRVVVPLLMGWDEREDEIAAQFESRACPVCGLPLNKDGCCISRCGADKSEAD